MYISTQKAREIQESLREQVELELPEREINTVGGADVSYNRGSSTVYAGLVVLSYPDLELLARSGVKTAVDFPYIPGLLAFRELPPLKEAWELLRNKPDIVIFDGHGLAHPRKMGIATHFGITMEVPSIGCAKNPLVGEYEEPENSKGNFTGVYYEGEKVGEVLRSRTGVKPVFVSPGHQVSFSAARNIVLSCTTRFKLPETTRMAHDLVNRLRRGNAEPGYVEF